MTRFSAPTHSVSATTTAALAIGDDDEIACNNLGLFRAY
jgi:hypothetical protein